MSPDQRTSEKLAHQLIEESAALCQADLELKAAHQRGGIEYFRAHKLDAVHNREHAKTKLPMPVLTVGGAASFGAQLAGQIRPLVENLRSVLLDECGHYLAEEQPARLTQELLRFLDE